MRPALPSMVSPVTDSKARTAPTSRMLPEPAFHWLVRFDG